ncbi:MAG: AAA family ATPase [Bacteroidetes bacterium]|nr:AAA family ATPase [Bacteroidota bacterium]
MFVFSAAVLLDEFASLAPDVLEAVRAAVDEAGNPPDAAPFRIPGAAYDKVPAAPFDKAVMEKSADVAVVPLKGFDLIPASSVLTKHMRRLNKPTDVLWVKEAIEHATAYDVILLDTAAAITVYSLNALVASHYVVIPVTPEYQPIMGAEQTFQTASMVRSRLNPDLALPHFLFTQVDARKRAHHMYRQYLRKRYKDHVMNSVIRTSAALANAYSDGTTVFDNNPYSRGARDYANATDEVIRILGLESLPEQETDAGNEDTSLEAPNEPAPS